MQTFNNKSNNSPFRVLQCDTGGQMPYATGKAFGRGKLFLWQRIKSLLYFILI